MTDILINIVLDKSGSMQPLAATIMAGFNGFIAEQKKLPGALVSLTYFDTIARQEHVAIPIDLLPPLDGDNYQPGGGTALYDAVMQSIKLVEKVPGLPPQILFVIITDGQENSSQKYPAWKTVAKAIGDKTKLGWEFVYLSSDPDAWHHAQKMGVPSHSTYGYGPSAVGTQTMFMAAGSSVTASRTTGGTVASNMSNFASPTNMIDPNLVDPNLVTTGATPVGPLKAPRKRATPKRGA